MMLHQLDWWGLCAMRPVGAVRSKYQDPSAQCQSTSDYPPKTPALGSRAQQGLETYCQPRTDQPSDLVLVFRLHIDSCHR